MRTIDSKIMANLTILIMGLFSFFWFNVSANSGGDIPSFDSVFFLKMAYNIVTFHEFGWLGYHEPCFYPLVVAMFSFFTNTFLDAGVLVSSLSIFLLIPVSYFLAKELFNQRVGIISVILLIFFPYMKSMASASLSEALYAFLLTLSIYILWLSNEKKSLYLSILAGISFTFAYLSRSEGLFILLFLLLALSSGNLKKRAFEKKRILVLLLVTAVFFTSSLPYLLYLKNHYGTLTLGTKTSGIYFWVRERIFNDPDPVRTEWGLSPDGEINLISMKSSDLISYWLKDPFKSIPIYLNNLKSELPGFMPKGSVNYHFPDVFPLYFAIPLFVGLLLRFSEKKSMNADGYLGSVFLIFLIYPLFTNGWPRYFVSYIPVFMILTASGLNEICVFLNKLLTPESSIRKAVPGELVLCTFLALATAYHVWVLKGGTPAETPTYIADRGEYKNLVAQETKNAAGWINDTFPKGSNFMMSWTRLPYYLEGKWIPRPDADFWAMAEYGKKRGADYVVFEVENDELYYKQLRSMYNPNLEFAGAYESTSVSYYVALFKILNGREG